MAKFWDRLGSTCPEPSAKLLCACQLSFSISFSFILDVAICSKIYFAEAKRNWSAILICQLRWNVEIIQKISWSNSILWSGTRLAFSEYYALPEQLSHFHKNLAFIFWSTFIFRNFLENLNLRQNWAPKTSISRRCRGFVSLFYVQNGVKTQQLVPISKLVAKLLFNESFCERLWAVFGS